jgi:hypothetical protein
VTRAATRNNSRRKVERSRRVKSKEIKRTVWFMTYVMTSINQKLSSSQPWPKAQGGRRDQRRRRGSKDRRIVWQWWKCQHP